MSKDLIFAMGPPGSRWSGVLRCIQMYHKYINTSDDSPERTYDRVGWSKKHNKETLFGWHRGSYFGPGHEYGQGFDDLENNYTKESFLEEIKKPFHNWNDIKIIKSHWFAYNIPTLKKWFPESKMIAVKYGNAIDSFAWWHFVGGWEITYPHYTWYKDNQRMFEQIQKEIDLIDQHFDCRLDLTMNEISNLLEIDNKMRNVTEMANLDDKFIGKDKSLSLENHIIGYNRVSSRLHIGII